MATQAVPLPVAATGSLEVYMAGLSWPVALAFASDGRIFFAERLSGSIRIIEGGTLLPTPFYTLAGTATSGEQGLLGLALDPGFPTAPWVYAYHTFRDVANATTYNRIVRIFAAGNQGQSHHVVLDRILAATFHNGGVIAFGPDGTLYAVVGEATVPSNAQNLLTKSGKVLRMNPDGSVPPDNPYAGNPNADPYVFTYGHRNMFGITFHPVTDGIFLSENGPNCNDEINLLRAGRNFGWGPSATCATPPPPPSNTNQDGPNPVLPFTWYTSVTAPTNLVVYGGPNFPLWQGDLFLGEYNTRNLRRIDLVPPAYESIAGQEIVATAGSGILDVEAGPDGAIWITTDDTIYRFVDTSQPPIAAFSTSPEQPLAGEPVTFNGSASSDPDGTIVAYAWTFGDGATGEGRVVTHTYETRGTFIVRLVVTDNDGATDETTKSIVTGNRLPVIVSSSPGPALVLNVSEAVTLIVQASDPDNDPLTYVWTVRLMPVGTSSPAYEFTASQPGTYSISVVVSDGSATVDFEWTVEVRTPTTPPILPAEFPWTLVFLISGAAIVVAAAIAVWRHRRRDQ